MKQEARLLRCISWIDDELVLEAAQTRFRSRRWGTWLALAACLALVLTIPAVLHRQPEPQLGEAAKKGTEKTSEAMQDFEATPEDGGLTESTNGHAAILQQTYNQSAILQTETIGGLAIGMTEQEITAILGNPKAVSNVEMECPDGSRRNSWFYKTGTNPDVNVDTELVLANTGDGWFLNEIMLHSGSSLTLSTGIGCGSWIDQVEAAYPDAVHSRETAVENDQTIDFDCYQVDGGLFITVKNGVSSINLGPWLQYPPEESWDIEPEPLPYDLTSEEITIYTFIKVWESVTAVDKAAKGISTVLTISEPEPTETPESTPMLWLDFGNGTAAVLWGDDTATVYTYEGTFDIQNTKALVFQLTGRFPGLDDYVQRAWDNPQLTWETEEAPAE